MGVAKANSLDLGLEAGTSVNQSPSMTRRRDVTASDEKRSTNAQHIRTALWFCVFGTSGWFSTNALYAEQPVFVDVLPEAQQFGNLLSVAVQCGNIFPIAYKILTSYCGVGRKKSSLPYTVGIMLVIAVALLLIVAFCWRTAAEIAGRQYSVVLLGVTVLCGGIGAMSNVTYWALASRHDAWCIKSMSTGMTIGGLLTTALAVVQNAGSAPRFSVEVFIVVAAVLQLGGLLSFIPIWRVSVQETKDSSSSDSSSGNQHSEVAAADEATPLLGAGNGEDKSKSLAAGGGGGGGEGNFIMGSEMINVASAEEKDIEQQQQQQPSPTLSSSPPPLTATQLDRWENVLLAVAFLVYGMTYVVPSLLPYLARYYKPESISDDIYRWMLVLQQAGDVLGRLSTMLPYTPSTVVLSTALSIVTYLFIVFVLGTIYRQSLPQWMPGYCGFVMPCLCLLYYFTRGYLTTSIYVWVKLHYSPDRAEKLSSNLGFCGQIGALTGTLAMFIAVSVLDVFGV